MLGSSGPFEYICVSVKANVEVKKFILKCLLKKGKKTLR